MTTLFFFLVRALGHDKMHLIIGLSFRATKRRSEGNERCAGHGKELVLLRHMNWLSADEKRRRPGTD